jgi:thiosulfate/3-mercaptopyruvate sulfurtransferase
VRLRVRARPPARRWPAGLATGGPAHRDGPIETGHPGQGPRLGPDATTVTSLDDVLAQHAAGLPIFDCWRDASWADEPVLVPGAQRLPTRLLLDDDGLALPAERVRQVAAGLGIDGAGPVIAYCGAAISAAQVWLALRTAGLDVRVHDGSTVEWYAPGLPTVPGPSLG